MVLSARFFMNDTKSDIHARYCNILRIGMKEIAVAPLNRRARICNVLEIMEMSVVAICKALRIVEIMMALILSSPSYPNFVPKSSSPVRKPRNARQRTGGPA